MLHMGKDGTSVQSQVADDSEHPPTDAPSFRILGVKINAVTLQATVDIMDGWIRAGRKDYVVLTGAHGIVEMQRDRELRGINNRAGLVTPDGMPEVWLGKLKGHRGIEKVYAPEIMLEVFRRSPEAGYRHFFYGGREGVADTMAARLRADYPGIRIVGTYCPPFRPLTEAEIEDLTSTINASNADIVWCGLGCPKQERWMDLFRPRLNAPVLIGVGAGFDFISGEKPLAPRWIRRSGLEWFYRLLSDPRRLWRRYGRVVPLFLWLVAREAVGLYNPDR